MDIAALGLTVRSDGVVVAIDRLNDLPAAAARAERGVQGVERSSRKADTALTGFSRSIQRTIGGFVAMAAATVGVTGIVRMSDEYTSLTNLLRVVAGEQGNVNQMLEDLNGVAGRTRAPLEATARLYQRVSVAANELGASNEEILRFTENVGLALAQQGGSAAAASGALLQLSQAMGAGVVRAEEFNSILEGAFPIAQAAARGLDAAGGSVAKLRGLIIEGKVTSEEFFRAILSQTDDLEAAFANTVPTVGGALSRVGDSMMLFIGALNESTGASDGLARAFLNMANALGDAADWVRENGDTIRTVMNTVIGSALIYGTGLMIQFGLSALTAGGQVTILTGALGLLKTAIISTGFGVLIVGAGYLLGKFFELSQAVGGFGNAMVYLKELGLEVWERLQLGGGALVEGYKAYTAAFVLLWREAFATVINLFADFLDTILDGTRNAMFGAGNYAAVAAIEASRAAIKASIGQMQEGANAAVETQKELVDEHFKNAQQMAKDALAPLYMWQALNDVIDAARQKAAGATGGATPPTPTTPGGAANDNEESLLQRLTRENDELKALREAVREGDEQYQKMAESIEITNLLREAGIDKESKEGKAIAEAVRQQNYLNAAIEAGRNAGLGGVISETDRTSITDRFKDLQGEMISREENPGARLEKQYLLELGIIEKYAALGVEQKRLANEAMLQLDRQYKEASTRLMLSSGEEAAGALAGAFRDMMGEQSAAYKAMFAVQQAFVIATASLNIADAMSDALAVGVTPVEKMAALAIVAANAAQIMTAINSVALGFAEGGYTGAGGKYDVAGLVHKGEVVWSQQDVARYGGWQNVDAMRRGIMPAANDNGGSGRIELDINVTVDDDGRIAAYVSRGMNEAVNASVRISDQRAQARTDAMQAEQRRPVISARGAA